MLIFLDVTRRWPLLGQLRGVNPKYVCGIPFPNSPLVNISEELAVIFEKTRHPMVERGDIRFHLLCFTEVTLPMYEKHDRVMQCLEKGLSMLTFDGSDKKRPIRVVVGSYFSYKRNLTMCFNVVLVSTNITMMMYCQCLHLLLDDERSRN